MIFTKLKKMLTSRALMTSVMTFIACQLSVSTALSQDIPAFPGAEGHARYATGGRGAKKVIHVTNLNDSGTGSFRNAVSGDAKKIIVFDVAGVIALKSDLTIGANTTILGQTAPAPGITLRYYTVNPKSNNVIRFIRIRRGQEKDINDGADASTARHYNDIMLDHCSFSWSIDEVASFYDNNNFTMQWCTIGESLCNAGHNKGAHGYGGIWGGKLASFHHNLICHVNNRSPRFNGARYNWDGYTSNALYSQYKWANTLQAENVDFRNCVVFNCGNGCYGGPGGGQINMVNNYYKSSETSNTTSITTVSYADKDNAGTDQTFWGMNSRYYISGNQIDDRQNVDWTAVNYDSSVPTLNGQRYTKDPNHYYGADLTYTKIGGVDCVPVKLNEPAPAGTVTTHSAEEAFNNVVTYAGASLSRDEVDTRYMTEAMSGTVTYAGSVTGKYGRIDLVSDINGYTEANFQTNSRPANYDTDKDGIPDAWEDANGLDPGDANDAMLYTIDTYKRYTNLEVFANSLVQDIMLGGNVNALESVDEYYPAYTSINGKKVAAIGTESLPDPTLGGDVSYTISQTTYDGTAWKFCNGEINITNSGNKGYSTGSANGIKYSAGVKYTISLPKEVSISKATFTGYDNYADKDSYLAELNGVEYDATDYVFPKKNGSSAQTVTHEVSINPAATGNLTFTPKGMQVVWVITLDGTKAGTTGIESLTSTDSKPNKSSNIIYNLSGQRVNQGYKGFAVKNGKKYILK